MIYLYDINYEILYFSNGEKDMKVMKVIHDLKNPILSITSIIEPLSKFKNSGDDLESAIDFNKTNNSDINSVLINTQISNDLSENNQENMNMNIQLYEIYKAIKFEVEDIGEMVESLRIEFKAKQGMEFNEERKYVNSMMLLQAFKNTYSNLAESCNNRLVLTICKKFPTEVVIKKSLVKRVIMNFVSNSLKHTYNGRVSISFKFIKWKELEEYDEKMIAIGEPLIQSHNYFCFEVSDNGNGIPPNKLNSIFEEKESDESAENWDGTGLGLPICAKLVQSFGGRIYYESKQGEMTMFKLCLPSEIVEFEYNADRQSYTEEPDDTDLDNSRKDVVLLKKESTRFSINDVNQEGVGSYVIKYLFSFDNFRENKIIDINFNKINYNHKHDCRTIYLCEDNKNILKRYENYCKKKNIIFKSFMNGYDCHHYLIKDIELGCILCTQRIIITDLYMPKMDGLELAKKIRQSNSNYSIYIVLLSADEFDSNKFEYTLFNEIMVKPLQLSELSRWSKIVNKDNTIINDTLMKTLDVKPKKSSRSNSELSNNKNETYKNTYQKRIENKSKRQSFIGYEIYENITEEMIIDKIDKRNDNEKDKMSLDDISNNELFKSSLYVANLDDIKIDIDKHDLDELDDLTKV